MSSSLPQDTKEPRRPEINSRADPAKLASNVVSCENAEAALIRSERLASLGRLASSLAHQINNPVAAVMNFLFLAKNNPDCPQAVKEDLCKAESELMRLSHVTRQTVTFYRESVEVSPVSLQAILDETLGLFETKCMAKGVGVEKRYAQSPHVPGVAGELRQVFVGLISNSLDAIRDSGTLKLRIREVSRCGARAARITIADNGHGIDPSIMPHIFEPLFTTRESFGTGLGLWVAKQVIEKHGGTIRFRSSTQPSRRGTTFVVDLPAAAPEQEVA